ncbi:unnamed protein product [Didymodactylos carnosus]|uniref:Uncharacterized protein n=1 Tax=Didymodactylos carnosus TaxID=1234261 RepID=A0A8S2DWG9_9BILA|nr:unnamed protein product [Didymodactylos carnosus]CAF3789277.1 unnamed protein product [Didymodactylos carnosus]
MLDEARGDDEVCVTPEIDDGRGGDGAESLRGDPREVDFSKLDEAGSLRGDPREEAKDSPSPTSGRVSPCTF